MSPTTTKSRSGKFLKDMGIYAIGNLGSKLVTFMLVPLYTYYIKPEDFGYYDLCFTAVLLMMPFVSLMLRDGAFRFLIESNNDERKRAIVSFVYKTLFRNTLIALIITLFVSSFSGLQYVWAVFGLLIAMSVYEVGIQVIRGLGYTKYFVGAGILSSLLIGLFSLLFVVTLDWGILGIFLANIVARIVTIFIVDFKLGIMKRYLIYKFNDSKINREILRYCLPLLPGSVCWWLVGSSNKLFIEHYLGLSDNGLYAVALKFTSILETFAFIFYQTWQETALRQYNSPDRDKFFTSILNNYFYILCVGVVGFSIMIKLNYFWLVDNAYSSSVVYIFPLCISAMFYSLSAFFDMGYQCSKKTMATLPGVILASIVNIAGNYFLIGPFGVFGVIASSILTFATLFVYRLIDTRRFFKISFGKSVIFCVIILLISGVEYYLVQNPWIEILYLSILLVLVVWNAPADLRDRVLSKVKRR